MLHTHTEIPFSILKFNFKVNEQLMLTSHLKKASKMKETKRAGKSKQKEQGIVQNLKVQREHNILRVVRDHVC